MIYFNKLIHEQNNCLATMFFRKSFCNLNYFCIHFVEFNFFALKQFCSKFKWVVSILVTYFTQKFKKTKILFLLWQKSKFKEVLDVKEVNKVNDSQLKSA